MSDGTWASYARKKVFDNTLEVCKSFTMTTATNNTPHDDGTTYWYEVGEQVFGDLTPAASAADRNGHPVVLVTVDVATGDVIERRAIRR